MALPAFCVVFCLKKKECVFSLKKVLLLFVSSVSAHLENQSFHRHRCLLPGSQLLLLRLTRGQLACYWALWLGCTCGRERWKLRHSKERYIVLSNSPCTIFASSPPPPPPLISSFLTIFTEISQEQSSCTNKFLTWLDNLTLFPPPPT